MRAIGERKQLVQMCFHEAYRHLAIFENLTMQITLTDKMPHIIHEIGETLRPDQRMLIGRFSPLCERLIARNMLHRLLIDWLVSWAARTIQIKCEQIPSTFTNFDYNLLMYTSSSHMISLKNDA